MILQDHCRVHDNYEDAKKDYQDVLETDDIYTASLCLPIDSTDYTTGEQWLVVWSRQIKG